MSTSERARQRAAEYRELANEMFAEVGVELDLELRADLVHAANACLRIAERLDPWPELRSVL